MENSTGWRNLHQVSKTTPAVIGRAASLVAARPGSSSPCRRSSRRRPSLIATHRSPPRVMVLIPSPSAFISIRPISSESGMALRLMMVVRRVHQEQHDDDRDDHHPLQQRLAHIADGAVNEVALPKGDVGPRPPAGFGRSSARSRSTARVTVGVSTSGCSAPSARRRACR